MTEQTNAELIADVRSIDSDWVLDNSPDDSVETIQELAAALEAAEQRAEKAEATAEHLHDEDSREIVALTQERDALAAVVEKVRAWAGSHSGSAVSIIRSLLATAPSDALREVKADAWDEGATAASEGYDLPDAAQIHNPYRKGQS